MGALWDGFMGLFQAGLFGLTQFYGGSLGGAIVALSLLTRLALLPLAVRVAVRGRRHARTLRALRPELEALRARWADDPARLLPATAAAYEGHGIKPVDPHLFGGALLQAPVFIGLFRAVRTAVGAGGGSSSFLWVARLGRPDLGVAALAVVLIGAGALAGASETQPPWTLVVPAVGAGVIALAFSSGLGLYLASSGLVGTLQGLLVRRIEARA